MGYATTTTGYVPNISKQADSRALVQLRIGGSSAVIIQTIYTVTEEWRGLSWSDAQSLVVASESSTIGGTTRPYLGAAKITLGSGGVSVWQTVEQAFGTRVTTQCRRMSDTSLYQVVRTTETLDVVNSGGSMERI